MVNVPQQYVPLLQQMSQGTGIPYNVEAAQADAESGFNPIARSSAGALGWLQFLPSTYDPMANMAGVPPGSEFNPADEAKVYVVYMNELLKQEGGDLRKALAAYNAGPGNLQAGYGYADSILTAAGQGNITVTGQPQQAQTSSFLSDPFGITSSITGALKGAIEGIFGDLFKALGVGSIKDLAERLGLILLGFALVIVGIHILSSGGGSQPINIQTTTQEGPSGKSVTRKTKTPLGTHTKITKTGGTGAAAAAESAAAA